MTAIERLIALGWSVSIAPVNGSVQITLRHDGAEIIETGATVAGAWTAATTRARAIVQDRIAEYEGILAAWRGREP